MHWISNRAAGHQQEEWDCANQAEISTRRAVDSNNVGNPLINLPLWDGLCYPFMVMTWGCEIEITTAMSMMQ
jgi:hypothetical protein